jgi:hypothetical protein
MWGAKHNKKAQYRRALSAVHRLKNWQLIIILLLGVLLSASLLRLNNLGMVERRSAVIAADESGDPQRLQASVVELQNYISHHMNTSLDNGFYLTKSYERDRDVALQNAGSATNPNSAVYQQASVECRSRVPGGRESFRNDYVTCVIERVASLSPQTNAEQSLNLPKPEAYKINFASPVWSPDLAGLSVAFCILVTLVIFGRLVLLLILRLLLRQHYRSI